MFWNNRGFGNSFFNSNNNRGFNRAGNTPQQFANPQLSHGQGVRGWQPQSGFQTYADGRAIQQMPQLVQQPPMPQMPQMARQMPQQMQQPPMPQMPQQMPQMARQMPQQMQQPPMPQMPQQVPQMARQMPQQVQQQPMPQISQIPQQMPQIPQQIPQQPMLQTPPQSIPAAQTPPQNISANEGGMRGGRSWNGQGAQNGTQLDNLKNVGTFMGYPEYTFPDVDLSKPEELRQSAQTGATRHDGADSELPSGIHGNTDFTAIKELCQNEKNGAEYYKNLSEKPSSKYAKDALVSISNRANMRSRRLMELHNIITKSNYEPENRNIKNDVLYEDGVRLAINEERQSLKHIAETAEKSESALVREKLNGIILEKLCQINELNVLLAD